MTEPLEEEKVLAELEANRLGVSLFSEISHTIRDRESEFIAQQTERLVTENCQKYGGSQWGFLYESELFCIAGGFMKEGLRDVDPAMHEEAAALRKDRISLQEHVTRIAHFMAYLDVNCDSIGEYVVNIPPGVQQLSPTLKSITRIVQSESSEEELEELRFKEEDTSKAPFFLHFEKVDNFVNRFLFRRLTR